MRRSSCALPSYGYAALCMHSLYNTAYASRSSPSRCKLNSCSSESSTTAWICALIIESRASVCATASSMDVTPFAGACAISTSAAA
ncbi:hypothetical protein BJX66DRAFT_302494 [Aspergillus keveii]|uniref:Secreted protein n=1 Tax=Aspergillus keveii TaxID=714993 RepID=A0ABR4G7L9_9EURO